MHIAVMSSCFRLFSAFQCKREAVFTSCSACVSGNNHCSAEGRKKRVFRREMSHGVILRAAMRLLVTSGKFELLFRCSLICFLEDCMLYSQTLGPLSIPILRVYYACCRGFLECSYKPSGRFLFLVTASAQYSYING